MSCAREQSPPSSAHALPHGPRKVKAKGAVVSDSLRPRGLYSPWSSLGQNTGVGSLSLLQGIFPTQGQNPGLPHCRQIPCQLSPQGSPAARKALQMPLLRRRLSSMWRVWGPQLVPKEAGSGAGRHRRKKESTLDFIENAGDSLLWSGLQFQSNHFRARGRVNAL